MASIESQKQDSWGVSSNRIASLHLEGKEDDDASIAHAHHQFDKTPGWKKFLQYVGPGFMVSLAYLDPGNLETDLQAGANHLYELLWVVLVGLVFALIIQSLAANLGVSTGKHLSELCKAEYPSFVKYCLWLLAELAVIAADIPEVIGTAFALNILFNMPVWVGVLCTGFSTLLLLGLQKYGVRKLELLITIMVFIMAACFFGELSYVKPPAKDVIKGIFVPKLSGHGATGDAIALLGALVMPHNLFLHSALVLSRKIPSSVRGINDACRYFLIESGFALLVAFLINVAVVSVSGTVCSGDNLSPESEDRCGDLTLDSASFLLQNVLGKSSSTFYAVALLASGQSSTITGTYAGQYVMQGFLDLKMRKWKRNLLTRCIATTPSLIVSIIGGPSGAGRLIIIASMILSFELPFALIPLLKFSSTVVPRWGHIKIPYTHNLFHHSALVLSRKIPSSVRGINDACRYFLIESGFALLVAFLINVAVVSVSGTVCSADNLSPESEDRCGDLTLNSASFLLQNVLGKSSSTFYAVALLASGQSSTITGTYAGQYVMQGFLDLKMRKWTRNLLTRCIAITPSLIVSIIGGSSGAGRLIIIASMILSFELPFALIPLLKFSSSSTKMGPHKNSIYIIVVSWILGFGIIGINIYYLSTAFVDWLIHNNLPTVGKVFVGMLVFPVMAIYLLSIIYLTFRKDTVVTYIEPSKEQDHTSTQTQQHLEGGLAKDTQQDTVGRVPYREDLADIPFPE